MIFLLHEVASFFPLRALFFVLQQDGLLVAVNCSISIIVHTGIQNSGPTLKYINNFDTGMRLSGTEKSSLKLN